MKYIVTRTEDGKEEIFIFSRKINHDCMAEVLGHIKNQTGGDWKRIRRKVISAGFIENNKCFGRSESLNLDSRGRLDEMLIGEY